jgi:ligand-binding sensor domain-containing protein
MQILQSTLLLLSQSSILDLTDQAIHNSANVVDVLDDLFIHTIRSVNRLVWQINTQEIPELKSKILEGLSNSESLSIPEEHKTRKLTSLYKKAMENVIDLDEQIPVTKKALENGPIQKGSYLLNEVEKYRKHLGIKN